MASSQYSIIKDTIANNKAYTAKKTLPKCLSVVQLLQHGTNKFEFFGVNQETNLK